MGTGWRCDADMCGGPIPLVWGSAGYADMARATFFAVGCGIHETRFAESETWTFG